MPPISELLSWIDLVFKPFVVLATIYWIVWHKREGRRMVREEESIYAPASQVTKLEKKVETLATAKEVSDMRLDLETHKQATLREINNVYDQMRKDAKSVAETFRGLTHELGKVEGILEAGKTKGKQ